ncbi:carbohydrate ABC transporter permease [Microbacterium enclense]|uniref:carbohydrate ABC transporter permease n=1 Tax=Microbacterium enclense TaxID=993073 RepID=UPI0021A41FBA|nr:carbohydrate ABC transporter permease [Microbacterium enclense]MCT2086497.1 carbohydrate ABC transporter permease [Microbacterium enclense]
MSATETATLLRADEHARTPRRRRRTLTPGEWLGRALAAVVAIFFAVFFILPLAWLVLAPTKTPRELLLGGPFDFGAFSTLAENWNTLMAFQNGIVWTWLGNAALYTGAALVLTLLVTIPAGYALAMIDFRLRRALLAVTLVIMLIPSTALVLPTFLELSAVRLIGNPLAVILPFSFFPFGVYLTYIYFSTSISKDLLDAARIDGAGEWRVFWRVAMPLATPVIALVGFFNVVGNWNNYFLPFVMVPGRRAPIQVGLAELLSNVPLFNPTSAGSVTIELPVLALATLVSVLPVLLIFLFSQRFLVTGMTAGGTKE